MKKLLICTVGGLSGLIALSALYFGFLQGETQQPYEFHTTPAERIEYALLLDRVSEIYPKYEWLLRCQPNAFRADYGFILDEEDKFPLRVPDGEGGYKPIIGLSVAVTERVPNESIPEYLRIPNEVEGFPILIIEKPELFDNPGGRMRFVKFADWQNPPIC